ncbi:hypothetical protein [Oceanibaculum indicum]|uniref:Uncharacterized protein n=1 Tax=Oceanibaculum indicum TaxID=526216 RepID=A0A420WGK4_9PROT|nr:hypothetical protein [Oceanibaculum indicum]RKQ70121.1 hypothetical protein BCL74_2061 [Oceanibaculum indicum]
MNLDGFLAREGRDVILRRSTGQYPNRPWADVPLRAFVRGLRPEEMRPGVQKNQQMMICSDREMLAAAWPAPPRHGDRVIDGDRTMTVIEAERMIWRGSTRYNIRIEG